MGAVRPGAAEMMILFNGTSAMTGESIQVYGGHDNLIKAYGKCGTHWRKKTRKF